MRALQAAALLLLASAAVVQAQPLDPESVRLSLSQVFAEVVRAEMEGANVTELAAKLNQALQLVREAEAVGGPESAELLREAEDLIQEVNASIPGLLEEAEAEARRRLILTGVGVAALVVGGVLAYVYLPRLVWLAWLRARRGWKVRRVR